MGWRALERSSLEARRHRPRQRNRLLDHSVAKCDIDEDSDIDEDGDGSDITSSLEISHGDGSDIPRNCGEIKGKGTVF